MKPLFLSVILYMIIMCVWKQYLCRDISLDHHNALKRNSFWHVTDIHVDQNYSRTGDARDLCHEKGFSKRKDNGLFGNFLCDSPLSLVNITIAAMKTIYSSPDFIIWTGDNLPHTRGFNPSWSVVFEALKNVTDILIDTFPSTPIYPCIGNHDTFPPNILIPNKAEESIYVGYLEKGGWNRLLSKEARQTFKLGGYFSTQINKNLMLISLNTILWYAPNPYTKTLSDPSNQFEWMERVLSDCSKNGIKVYIIGHVPPGYYNRVIPGSKADATFHPQYLKKYLSLMNKYSRVIQGQIFGHLHLDMFQLYQCNTGVFVNSALLGSSVTPWHTPDAHNTSLPVNPSIRLVHYDVDDSTLKDYEQYFLNLTLANELSMSPTEKSSKYELLYTFTEAYKVPDLTTRSLEQVFEKLKANPSVYDLFFKYMTASKVSTACDKNCVRAQLCSMSATSEEEYSSCMTNYN